MNGRTRRARLVALLALLALVVVACRPGEPDDEQITDPEGEPVDGGTLVFAHQQEPDTLNPLVNAGNVRGTWMVARTVLLGAYRVTPDLEYVPELLDGEAEVSEEDDEFTVTWQLRDDAEWSDGTPISAEDLQFTYDTVMDEDWDISTRAGYELITDTDELDEHTWQATFSEPYAPYRTLFTVFPVLPAHVLDGVDFDEAWTNGIVDPATDEPIASGPFRFERWDTGQEIRVVRNEAYWGESASLDRIAFRYLDAAAAVREMDAGEVHLFDPQPNVVLIAELEELDGVDLQAGDGLVWEHLYLNLDHDVLSQRAVRQAIVRSLDRDAIVEQLLGEIHPDAAVLENVLQLRNHEHHEPNWDVYEHDPDEAVELLEEAGCTREAEDEPFECDGEELVLRYVSTAGNERREALFELVAEQLAAIGIGLEEDFGPPVQALGTQLPDGDFDLINFGWSGGIDPAGSDALFRCDGEFNHNGYCNEDVDEQLEDALRILDDADRGEAYNAVDELLARDVPLIPLYQLPDLLAFRDTVGGVRVSPTPWGPTGNAGEWYLAAE